MNERIRDLAFECARQLDWRPPSDPKEYTFSSAGLKKFAELIVQECAERLLNDAKLTDIQTTRCVASIKEHFGVDTSC